MAKKHRWLLIGIAIAVLAAAAVCIAIHYHTAAVAENEAAQALREKETKNTRKTREPLSDKEQENILRQAALLQELSETSMPPKTAENLAEAFVRCIRLETSRAEPQVCAVRYEQGENRAEHDWDIWIVTSSAGTDYWMWGFTHYGVFYVDHVYQDTRDGELLYGWYDDIVPRS